MIASCLSFSDCKLTFHADYIFDAKSPRSDDSSYFKAYIKAQSESAKKYAELSGIVHPEIFLVVPTDTYDEVSELNSARSMGNYSVNILSQEGIEPALLLLKQIEETESNENLSPQDENHMVKIISSLSHLMKRHIQVNQFFINKEFTKLVELEKSIAILPKYIQEKIQETEASNAGPINNPKMDKKGTIIAVNDLMFENGKIATKLQRFPSVVDTQKIVQIGTN